MKFQDNFSETHLLFSYDVEFLLHDEENPNQFYSTKMHLPTFKECYFDYKFQNFLYIINSPIANIQKKLHNINTSNSLFSIVKNILIFPDANYFYYNIISYSLKLCLPDMSINNMSWTICSCNITEEFFNRIIDLILVAIQQKKMHELAIIDPTLREMEERINKIKKQGNKVNNDTSFINSFMILTYEFNYKPEEILKMTMYCISTILKYTSKSINYKVSLIGAGNGLSKKVHFITEKGK